jgi:hypothetical protein
MISGHYAPNLFRESSDTGSDINQLLVDTPPNIVAAATTTGTNFNARTKLSILIVRIGSHPKLAAAAPSEEIQ